MCNLITLFEATKVIHSYLNHDNWDKADMDLVKPETRPPKIRVDLKPIPPYSRPKSNFQIPIIRDF